jgi:hypothetical protein
LDRAFESVTWLEALARIYAGHAKYMNDVVIHSMGELLLVHYWSGRPFYDDDRLPMMEFTLSKHAEDTMREREIDLAWLAATMDAPETTKQHPDDPTLIYAFRRIPEFGNRVLRVVYNQTKEPPHIVTVYFDRTAGGKR